MHPRQGESEAKPAGAWRRHFKRHRPRDKRLQPLPEMFEFVLTHARGGAPSIYQLTGWVIISQHQRANARSAAFGVGPTYDGKFLSIETFCLDPQATVARSVWRVGLLRYDAFEHIRHACR
jgi:hypothetical protein